MKKLVFALVLGLLLIAALATTALADNGPHGGAFSATTDSCANCHRAHSAVIGENALLVQEAYAICMTCHNGTGAGTNVEDGVYSQTGSDAFYVTQLGMASRQEGQPAAPLFGGGFINTAMNTTWTGLQAFTAAPLTSNPTTSAHVVEGLPVGGVPSLGVGTVWGSGANNTGNDTVTLECISCHNPHGRAGWTMDGNPANGTDALAATYRLLKFQPDGSNGFTAPATSVNWSGGAFPTSDMGTATLADNTIGWTVPDNVATLGGEWYTINSDPAFVTFPTPSGTTDYRTRPFGLGDYSVNTEYLYATTFTPPLAGQPAFDNRASMRDTAYFCAQCHDRYLNNSRLRNNTDESAYCGLIGDVGYVAPVNGSSTHYDPTKVTDCLPYYYTGTTAPTPRWLWADVRSSGDNVYQFRHSSGDLRISMDGTTAAFVVNDVPGSGGRSANSYRTCLSCHVAHGTSAAMTGLAGVADSAGPPAVVGGSLAGGSTLLRMDSRSICLRCHASGIGSAVIP